jgi:hypothetical protein
VWQKINLCEVEKIAIHYNRACDTASATFDRRGYETPPLPTLGGREWRRRVPPIDERQPRPTSVTSMAGKNILPTPRDLINIPSLAR